MKFDCVMKFKCHNQIILKHTYYEKEEKKTFIVIKLKFSPIQCVSQHHKYFLHFYNALN